MTHPVEQLVDYVDGTLPPRERAVVREHLTTCARCRDEVALSAAAKRSLAELPEVRVPAGLGAAAVERAEAASSAPGVTPFIPRGDRKGNAGQPGWYRWGGAAAAVAAALLVVVVVLPRVGGDPATPASAPAAEGTAESGDVSFTAARRVERQQRDYDTRDVQALAERFAVVTAPPPTAEDRAVDGAGSPVPAASGAPDALTCLEQAAPHLADAGPPIELIEARFRGTPAYFGVFASGPGAGEDADTITVWVVPSEDCSTVLNTTLVGI